MCIKKLQSSYDENELGAESRYYLTEKNNKMFQKKMRKERKQNAKKQRRNNTDWFN